MTLAPGDTEGGPDNRHRGSDQWLFVVGGEGTAIVGGERVELREGTLVLIQRGETPPYLLRYETQWFNELLLSHLLSPVGGGPLSQFVSQQEYSKLFEASGIPYDELLDRLVALALERRERRRSLRY